MKQNAFYFFIHRANMARPLATISPSNLATFSFFYYSLPFCHIFLQLPHLRSLSKWVLTFKWSKMPFFYSFLFLKYTLPILPFIYIYIYLSLSLLSLSSLSLSLSEIDYYYYYFGSSWRVFAAASTGDVLFNSSVPADNAQFNGMTFEDQFLEISTQV